MTHTNSHSETLTAAIQPRTMETPSAQLRHSRSCFAEANQQSGFAGKLLAVAAAIAVFSAALAWSFSSQRLEAQTIEASPEPAIQATGQQSLSSVPSDAIRLFYNCTEEGEESSLVRHSYVRVFSSRNVSSCSGYEQGDYILRAVIDGRFPGLYYPSGTFRFNVRFETYIVGSVPWASEGDARVEDFDYYIDGARHSVSALGCGTNLVSRSLSFTSSVFETTLLCNSVYWERVLARHWIVPGENTAIHILPPEFTEWPLPNVQVIRLEVTQGVQDWNNDLTLVRNRRTVVRAFMETAPGSERELTAQLQGKKFSADGGVLFTETTDPVNPGLSITVMPNVVERRGNIDTSLNFILPPHWTDLEENEELRLELVSEPGSNINCFETIEGDDTYNRCVERVEFTEVSAPRIIMVPLIAKDSEGNEATISSDALEEQYDRIMSIIPLPHQEFEQIGVDRIGLYPFTFGPYERTTNLNDTISLLWILRNDSVGVTAEEGEKLVYLGVLPGNAEGGTQGRAGGIGGSAASWFVGTSGDDHDTSILNFSRIRNTGSHEVGHVFGQYHPRGSRELLGSMRATCGEKTSAPDSYPEYKQIPILQYDRDPETNKIRRNSDGTNRIITKLEWRPILGPLNNNSETEVWGLDTRFVDLPDGASVPDGIVVPNPNKIFSFMSYCNPIQESENNVLVNSMGPGRWMDAFHHERIIEFVNEHYSNDIVGFSSNSESPVHSDLFSGYISLSPAGDPINVELFPVFSRPRITQNNDTSDYTLELQNASGETVRKVPFVAIESVSEPSLGNEDFHQESREADFAFFVPDIPTYTSFTVKKGEKIISSFNLSPSPPSVTITGPTLGQVFSSGDSINLSWSGSDLDGDDLVYRVYYSTDGGSSYEILALETDRTSGSILASKLRGSDQARFGVSVSDGLRSSFAETPVFSVPGHAPTIEIERPVSGAVFAENQGFLLDASGYDIEDGGFSSESFNWTSSIDGYIGTGEFLVLSAANLTSGDHIITLSATDSDGMTASKTVDITITDRNMLPIANDDEAFGGLEETLRIDVLANDIDIEGDFDLSTLTIDDRPRLGIAEVSYTAQGLPIIEYSPITGGEDTFSYYICDGLYRCDTAEVAVVFPDCTITGTRGSDNLVGTPGDDVICGLDGDDFIDGKAGNDLIYAGFGEDVVSGRTGDDTIYGGPGNDLILGHRGDDTIYGGLSNDRLYGGGGNDIIYGGDETDEVYGEADNDILYGNDGPDKIHGGQGDDTIYGGDGDDTIRGNAGVDTIYPGVGTDTIFGLSSEDTVS